MIRRVAPVKPSRMRSERTDPCLERRVVRLKRAVTREVEGRAAEADMTETMNWPCSSTIRACNELDGPNRAVNGSVAAQTHARGRSRESGTALNRPCARLTRRIAGLSKADNPKTWTNDPKIQTLAPGKRPSNGGNARNQPMREGSRRLDGSAGGLKAKCVGWRTEFAPAR